MIELIIPVGLLILAFFTGRTVERNHFKRLARYESDMQYLLLTNTKRFPGDADGAKTPCLVIGQAVIASDYLKTFLANIRHILGGEMKGYERLMDRARREATRRMMEQARQMGYDAVCNIRIESSDIGGKSANRKYEMVTAEAMVYGTAYCRPGFVRHGQSA